MDTIIKSWKNLMRRKMKFVLTLIGIVIGVISVVIISCIGEVGKHELNQELSSMGVGGILVTANPNGNPVILKEEQLLSLQEMEEVSDVSPLMVDYSTIQIQNNDSKSIIWGIGEETEKIVSMDVIHGRMINQSDISTLNKVCMVDESFAQEYYQRSNIVGKKISIFLGNIYEEFEIVGITKSGGNVLQGLMGNVVPTFAYIPYSSMQSLSLTNNINQIVVKLQNGADESLAEKSISKAMDTSLKMKNSVIIENLNSQIDKLNRVLEIVSIVLTVIGGISLIVSGLSIMTIMLVSVNERTREIGIKKAIGASQKDIITEFITEAVLITIIGGFLGIVLGLILAFLGCSVLGVHVIINYSNIAFIMFFSVCIGVVFGVYPAYKASKLKPVDALRCD